MVVGHPGLPLPPPWAARGAFRVLGARGRVGPWTALTRRKNGPPATRDLSDRTGADTRRSHSHSGHAPGSCPVFPFKSPDFKDPAPPDQAFCRKTAKKKLSHARIRLYSGSNLPEFFAESAQIYYGCRRLAGSH